MDIQRGNPWAGFAGRPVIAPSLLACDFAHVGREIDWVLDAGADVIHLDVMDGHFVTNLSMGPPVVESIRKYTDAVLDVHIMVTDPAYYIERFAEVGADSITFHIEASDHPVALVQRLGELGLGAGVSLRPATGPDALSEIIEAVDLVLVMTVEPGYGGQKFMDDMLDKITAVRGMLRPDQRLEVDGGIDYHTAGQCARSGADVFVAGSNIFRADDAGEAIDALKQTVSSNRGTN
ncbi:MAG: ribulose-phosphate 3-epimerase [Phycisphaerae bacterium]|jgi:ribulose-phosphate 3-epimerase|nr:ribulose-phosphate 3-epimerase [Phycisphaerae bacterium]